jgi:hypothetical protein
MSLIADMGIPLFVFLPLPAMLFGLVAVIVSEVVVARKMLPLSRKQALTALVVANVASTALGFPFVWFFLIRFGLYFLPYGRTDWKETLASLYLTTLCSLVPSFFASVYIERWICFRFWRYLERERIRRFSWSAHFVSYSVLLAVALVFYGALFRVFLH